VQTRAFGSTPLPVAGRAPVGDGHPSGQPPLRFDFHAHRLGFEEALVQHETDGQRVGEVAAVNPLPLPVELDVLLCAVGNKLCQPRRVPSHVLLQPLAGEDDFVNYIEWHENQGEPRLEGRSGRLGVGVDVELRNWRNVAVGGDRPSEDDQPLDIPQGDGVALDGKGDVRQGAEGDDG